MSRVALGAACGAAAWICAGAAGHVLLFGPQILAAALLTASLALFGAQRRIEAPRPAPEPAPAPRRMSQAEAVQARLKKLLPPAPAGWMWELDWEVDRDRRDYTLHAAPIMLTVGRTKVASFSVPLTYGADAVFGAAMDLPTTAARAQLFAARIENEGDTGSAVIA